MKAPKCELCSSPANKSSIVGDIYYRHLCVACYESMMSTESPSTGEASFNRSRDAEDNEAYMIQPYSGGKVSAEFIHLYPQTARKMFTPEEIDKATRS